MSGLPLRQIATADLTEPMWRWCPPLKIYIRANERADDFDRRIRSLTMGELVAEMEALSARNMRP